MGSVVFLAFSLAGLRSDAGSARSCAAETLLGVSVALVTNGRSFTVTFSNAYPRYADNSHKSTKLTNLSLTTAIRQILPHRPCANSFVLAGVVARAVVGFFSLSYGVTPTSSFP